MLTEINLIYKLVTEVLEYLIGVLVQIFQSTLGINHNGEIFMVDGKPGTGAKNYQNIQK